MTATEIILTIALAVACIIGGVLLYRLEHVTALNIDLQRINKQLQQQLDNIGTLIKQEFAKVYNNKKDSSND